MDFNQIILRQNSKKKLQLSNKKDRKLINMNKIGKDSGEIKIKLLVIMKIKYQFTILMK